MTTTIIDPELTLRLGALDADTAPRVENYAAATFMFRGYSQDDALHVARGLHWCLLGGDPAATADDIASALVGRPPNGNGRPRTIGAAARGPLRRPDDYREVGRKVADALAQPAIPAVRRDDATRLAREPR